MAKAAKPQKEEQVVTIDLQSYLDTKTLSRAEKTYYQRTYGKEYKLMTPKEWSELTGVV